MQQISTPVTSFFHNRNTRFGLTDSTFPLMNELIDFRKAFALSNGKFGKIKMEEIGNVRVDYEGQLTIVSRLDSGEILQEYCSGPDAVIINYPTALQEFRQKLNNNFEFAESIFCLSINGYNFHHFLFEILPALYAFREQLENSNNLILGATSGGSYIRELNDLLELHTSLQTVPLRSTIKVIDAETITPFPFRIYPTELIDEIKERVLSKVIGKNYMSNIEICFIGRGDRDRNRRQLLNEDEVVYVLNRKYGTINIVRPGVSKLEDTVRTLSGAKILVGMLGGSLAHLIWARELDTFIEIVPISYIGPTETEELSKIFKFRYLRVDSHNVDSDNWAWANQNCDLNQFIVVLSNL